MKNLKLSDLENISGGNIWNTIGVYTFCAIIIAELFYLQYKITDLLGEVTQGFGNATYDSLCLSRSNYKTMIRRLDTCN